MKNGEDANAKCGEDDENEEDEEREVLEGTRVVVVGDLEVLGRVGFGLVGVWGWRRWWVLGFGEEGCGG